MQCEKPYDVFFGLSVECPSENLEVLFIDMFEESSFWGEYIAYRKVKV